MAEPLYRQIAEDLREQIESGSLQPGHQLTELELRDRYGASRNTVRDAIKWLTSRGLVEARTGQGTFVTRPIDPFVTTLSAEPEGVRLGEGTGPARMPSCSPMRVEIQKAGEDIAAALHLPRDAEVVSRHERRYIDGGPWSLQTSFYSMELVTRGAVLLIRTEHIRQGALDYLKETLGLDQVGYQDLIKIRTPDMTEAAFFGLPDDGRISVITVLRTAYTVGPVPLRATITIFPADRNQLLIKSGEVPGTDAW